MRHLVSQTLGGLWAHIAPLHYADELAALVRAGEVELARNLPDAWLTDLSLVGTEPEVRAGMARLADAGADSLVLMPGHSWDPDAWLESVAPLAV